MSADGVFAAIIPFDQMSLFINIALIEGIYCFQKLIIYPTSNKPANRIILEFCKNGPIKSKEEELTIRDSYGNFTEQYKSLTQDFYLNF